MSLLLVALVIGAEGSTNRPSDFALEHATYLVSDSSLALELSYDIPYELLAFTRTDSGYHARFSLAVQCWSGQRLVRAQDWVVNLTEPEYDATMRRGARATGSRVATVPRGKLEVEAAIEDLQSERRRTWRFRVTPPTYLSDLRVQRLGRPARVPTDSTAETLQVTLDVYRPPAPRTPGETLALRITEGRRIRAAENRPIAADSLRTIEEFRFPLAQYRSSDYEIVAQVRDARGRVLDQRKTSFAVRNSFFLSNREYEERVNQLLWIASPAEMNRLRAALPAQRESLWQAFWRTRDQTPTTEENETEQEYFARIDYCIAHFSRGDRGYRSDRARVYVKLGPPDNIESRPFEADSNALEIWSYSTAGLSFVSEDLSGFGEFRLVEPRSYFQR
ncbi:MAG: GWxTD domain-containing protein [candidate division WOR-3 bacterium]